MTTLPSTCTSQDTLLPQYKWTIVSGGLGVGKSTLVRSGEDAIFYGCFEPPREHQRGSSYSVFGSALRAFVENVSKERVEAIDFGFDAADMEELVELFPCLAAWFGKKVVVEKDPGVLPMTKQHYDVHESTVFAIANPLPKDTFHIGLPELLVRLFKALPTIEKGRFVFEDWHWADQQSVEILQALFEHREELRIPVVCTYRNDVSKSDKSWKDLLLTMLAANEADTAIGAIELVDWSESHLSLFLAKKYMVVDELQSLSQLVRQKTQGNPLFIHHFIAMLRQERMIMFPDSVMEDPLSLEEAEVNSTLFDPEFESSLPTNLAQCIHRMVMNKLEALPTLKCLVTALKEHPGDGIKPKVLAIISNQNVQQVEHHLSLLPSFFTIGQTITFTHRELERCVFTMLNEEERTVLHYQNGIRLWQQCHSTIEENEIILQQTVQQLEMGAEHIENAAEVSVFATLCLKAGEKAVGSSHFSRAWSYFHHAIGKLGPSWTVDNHDALLTLHNLAAEASYAAGNFEQMDFHINSVLEHSKSIRDDMRARITRLFANGARNKTNSVNEALSLLRELGAHFPVNPGTLMVVREFLKTRWLLRNKTIIDFLQLPLAVDPDEVALMQVLFFAFVTFYTSNPKLALVVTFRLIQLTIKCGVSGPGVAAFATYSFLLVAAFERIDEAYKYGLISLQLGRAFSARTYLARGRLSFYGYISQWFTPYHEHFEPLKKTYRLALQTGDMESAAFGCAIITDLSVHTGRPLDQVENETRMICKAMDRLNQIAGLAMTMVIYTFIVCDLLGQPLPDLNLQGPVRDSESARSLARHSNTNVPSNYVEFLASSLKVMILSLRGQHEESVQTAIAGYEAFENEANPDLMMYEGVSALIASRTTPKTMTRIRLRRRGTRLCRTFRRWANKCPANFRGRYSLLMAELSACRGRHLQAIRWFETSIRWATQQGLTVDEGFANACMGDYLCEAGFRRMAMDCYRNAKQAYQKWGATTLVAHMDSIIHGPE